MNRKFAAALLGSAGLAVAALAGAASTVADATPSASALSPAIRAAHKPPHTPIIKGSQLNGHRVATFELVRSSASVAKNCLPYAKATVSVEHTDEVDIMRVHARGLPRDTEFAFFVLQAAEAPFGLAWYQGDLQTDKRGIGSATYIGRFNEETFSVATGSTVAPVVHSSPIADGSQNPVTAPIHQYHLGFWFNSPADAAAAGCLDVTTAFNGEHDAGVQAMSTRQFPALSGPLGRLKS